MGGALSSDWREHLTPDEARRVATIEALLLATKPLRAERREIELKARGRSRTKRRKAGPAGGCHCYRCDQDRGPEDWAARYGAAWPFLMKMFLCETCGNKRCPHAADHRLGCTGSNKPGQKGSLYEDAHPFTPAESRANSPSAESASAGNPATDE